MQRWGWVLYIIPILSTQIIKLVYVTHQYSVTSYKSKDQNKLLWSNVTISTELIADLQNDGNVATIDQG